jgi:hypothetical protein
VTVVLASERTIELNLRLHALRRICALQSIDGAHLRKIEYDARLRPCADSRSKTVVTQLIALQTSDTTPEEKQLMHFTLSKALELIQLRTLPSPTDGRPPKAFFVLIGPSLPRLMVGGRLVVVFDVPGSLLLGCVASLLPMPLVFINLIRPLQLLRTMLVTFGDTTNSYQQDRAVLPH